MSEQKKGTNEERHKVFKFPNTAKLPKESYLWIQPGSKLSWGYRGEGWLPGSWQVAPVGVQEEVEDKAVDQPLIVVEQPYTVTQLLLYLVYMGIVADNHDF